MSESTFWGEMVTVDRPITVTNTAERRLFLSLVTMGVCPPNTPATERTFLSCKVGSNGENITICSVNSIHGYVHLDLQFEESVDVIFSTYGPASLHLAGRFGRPENQEENAQDKDSMLATNERISAREEKIESDGRNVEASMGMDNINEGLHHKTSIDNGKNVKNDIEQSVNANEKDERRYASEEEEQSAERSALAKDATQNSILGEDHSVVKAIETKKRKKTEGKRLYTIVKRVKKKRTEEADDTEALESMPAEECIRESSTEKMCDGNQQDS